ncbi:MAG TPA: DNA alkylation repair protein [Halanaerobiales bacterium]|nr:DNA alkylation repair protein [Halanaerobiales bacterium]
MVNDFSADDYIKKVKEVFEQNKDEDKAVQMEKYMRNKFEFYGIQAKERRELSKKLQKIKNRPPHAQLSQVIIKLWSADQRELQYFAMELFERYKNDFRIGDIKLMVYMIENKSWWDTVDFIAKKLVGEYFKEYPQFRDEFINKWLTSNNIWLQRTSLLFQLAYKKDTDETLLFSNIKRLKEIDEFFIQKAIGWSLREYSRTAPKKVEEFINNNKLSNLSSREGMKVIKKNKEKDNK